MTYWVFPFNLLERNEVFKKEVEIRIGYNKGYDCVGDAFKC